MRFVTDLVCHGRAAEQVNQAVRGPRRLEHLRMHTSFRRFFAFQIHFVVEIATYNNDGNAQQKKLRANVALRNKSGLYQMKECHFEALIYASAGMLLWFYALYRSQMLLGVSRNQLVALLVTEGGAIVYWYYLMLLTMEKIEIGPIQFVGLVFAMLTAFLSWLRFVFTTRGHTG